MIGISRPLLACIFLTAPLGRMEAAQCITKSEETPKQSLETDLSSVVITKKNPDILDAEAFSLAKTLDNIITTARSVGAEPKAAEREALLDTLLEGLRADELSNKDGIIFSLKPRDSELALTAKDLLDAQGPNGMQPVGLFNRLDLAPQDLSNCGEYRIVYAKNFRLSDQRFFLIFEAALRNSHGVVGCQQVAAFWTHLKTLSPDQQKRALITFYYSGGPISTGGLAAYDFKPVVHFQHFGQWGEGQVRWNQAPETSQPWHLREWNVILSEARTPIFNAAPTKETPLPAYFGEKPVINARPPDAVSELQASFQNEFLGTYVGQLTSIDAEAVKEKRLVGEQELIAGLGVKVQPKFYGAESIADNGPHVDSPTERAGDDFKAKVATQLGKLNNKLADECKLTAEHVLNRMGAMTCGGCHHFSNGRFIAPGFQWPRSLRFVHIDEQGDLSDLLLRWFLPARADITSEVASGHLPRTLPVASAEVLQKKSAALRKLLEPAQGRFQQLSPQDLIDIEALSSDLRRLYAQEPGAFVMFRKPD
jgi:hypothetical protein